jgi:hypothetical protein
MTMEKDTSTDEINILVVEFLKDALTYLEARINLIDNKASIFIAIQGGIFAIITYVIKEVFWTDTPSIISSVCYASLILDSILAAFAILLLVQTIRPTETIFILKGHLNQVKMEGYVMWPNHEFPQTAEDYIAKIASLDISKIKANYENAHFTALQIIRNKYKYYRWAVFLMKFMILFSAIEIGILGLLKLLVK